MKDEKYYNLVPSIGGSFGFGWRKMFERAFLPLLLAVIIVGLIDGPAMGIKWNIDDGDFTWPMVFLFPIVIFGLAYAFLFVPVIKYGENFLFLKAMRDEDTDLKVLFEGFKSKYLNIILANLIVHALAVIGFFMLIIPGIIVLCRLSMVPFLVMDKDLDAIKAIEKSWQMTRGHGWKIFWMGIISFFVVIGGLLVFFFGVLISLTWIHAAFATMYQSLLNGSDEENPIPILGVNE